MIQVLHLPIQNSTDYTKFWLPVFNSAVEQWPADQEKTQSKKATKETELWTSSLEPSHRYEQHWALPILLPTLTTISCTWILGKGSLTWDNALTTDCLPSDYRTYRTATKWPSLGMAIWDARMETSVLMSTFPSSIAQQSAPIAD